MPICKDPRCRAILKWVKPYKTGDKPVNQDGTQHICKYKQISRALKYHYQHCGKCPEEFGWCLKGVELEQHMKIWHSKDEEYSYLDKKLYTPIDSILKKYWKSDKHISNYIKNESVK